jgi:hypothetical protein
MSALTESYVVRVLLAPRQPCGLDAVNGRRRWLRDTFSNPY